jgi:DegV family protein with EDD domain
MTTTRNDGSSSMVKIITDTTSCLGEEFSRKYDVPIIPQVINFGEQSYLEGSEMDIDAFMERLKRSSQLPKTSAPPPELFVETFAKLVPLGEPILCIHPSSDVSGTVRAAVVAARDFPDADIRVIDTRSVASPLATMAVLAAEWAKAGMSADGIETRVNEMIPRCRIYFLVSTLEYLAKGGRIGGAAALLGNVLQIKPILSFREGKVDQYERERTSKRALRRLVEIVLEQYPRDKPGYLSVMHAGVHAQGLALAKEFTAKLNLENVPVYSVPPAIVTHGGPGILGVGFFA